MQKIEERSELFLVNCIHPFEAPENVLYNIYTGETCTEKANIIRSYEIGTEMMLEFNHNLPEGFRFRFSNKVITMANRKKSKKNGETNEIYNTELIFSRIMYLLSSRQIKLESIFHYELAPVPTSIFQDSGEPRFTKSKSVLKNKLKIEVSPRNLNPDAVIIDGGGMLHSAVHWPKEGTVKDFTDGVCNYIIKILKDSDVNLAFDRYTNDSIKAATRLQRIGNIKRSDNVSLETPLPPKEVALSSNKTKENLIELISNELLDRASNINYGRKLIVTSKSNFPEQSFEGERVTRYNMGTTFDEADCIIPQQVVTVFEEGKHTIKVISADTDVFILLCHYYHSVNIDVDVLLEDFSADKTLISISKSVAENTSLIPSLLSAHALTGCDTVPIMFGIGKTKLINIVKTFPLKYLGIKMLKKTII